MPWHPYQFNLGDVVRIHYRKEWSYLFDSIIKVFSGKVSNVDAITTPMQLIAYSLLYDKYFNLSRVILTEIGYKLGNKESRATKIYFARFIILTNNHLVREVVFDMADRQAELLDSKQKSSHGPCED